MVSYVLTIQYHIRLRHWSHNYNLYYILYDQDANLEENIFAIR